ncbi:MAG: OmpH family outer membrane protein, partial [Acidobacteriota bacterium]|nr:OmpH family outer membrane protein [Acidobacteriota bacterium]
IDMQSALISTRDGQKAVADLRARFGPRNDGLQKRQQDLQAKQDQYRRTQNTISEEAKTNLERDIDTLTRTIQRDTQDAKEEMDAAEQQMVTDLGGKVMQVLTKYANDNHYTLIFDVSGQPTNILFASSTVEITREIIALYDKEAGGSASAPPAAKPAGIPSGAAAPRKPAVPGTPAPAPK